MLLLVMMAFLGILSLGHCLNTTTFAFKFPHSDQGPIAHNIYGKTFNLSEYVVVSGLVSIVTFSPPLISRMVVTLERYRYGEDAIASLTPLAKDLQSATTSLGPSLWVLRNLNDAQLTPIPAVTYFVARHIRRLSMFVYAAGVMEGIVQGITLKTAWQLDIQLDFLVKMSELVYISDDLVPLHVVEKLYSFFSMLREISEDTLSPGLLVAEEIKFIKELVEETQTLTKELTDLISSFSSYYYPTLFFIQSIQETLVRGFWGVPTKQVALDKERDAKFANFLIKGSITFQRLLAIPPTASNTPTPTSHASPTPSPIVFSYVASNTSVHGWEF